MGGKEAVIMIKLRTLILIWLVILALLVWAWHCDGKSFDQKVSEKLTGGTVTTKSMALWELYQYQYTTLLRKSPMCYAPWQAYMAIQRYVTIDGWDFNYKFRITANLKQMLRDDAVYNRDYAKSLKFTGTKKQKVKKIWKWCSKTNYHTTKNTTRDAFQYRESLCAGISGAFYVLCRVNKIPVRYVIGWVDNGKGCHAWNRVKVNGRWYWVDCTFRYWLCPDLWDGRTVMEMW